MLSEARLQAIVCTSRPREAEAFYRDVLGLRLRCRSEGAAVFDIGGGDLRLSAVASVVPAEHTTLGFAVEDVHAAVAGLVQRGVTIERFPRFRHADDGVVTTPGGARVAWFRDPDGNLLSVVEYRGSKT